MTRRREAASTLRVEAAVRYWAYGANLSPAVLARRRLRPLAASPAVLHDHRLLFNHRTGFANVEPAGGRSAHGVLYELSDADWLRLQEKEVGPPDRDGGCVSTSRTFPRHRGAPAGRACGESLG